MSDRIFAGVWLLLCTGGLFIAWQIHSEYSYEPVGPRPFPLGIIGLMLLCSALMLLRRPDAVEWPGRHVLQRLLTMVVVLVVYAWGFEWLGFPLATALLTAIIGLLFGAGHCRRRDGRVVMVRLRHPARCHPAPRHLV